MDDKSKKRLIWGALAAGAVYRMVGPEGLKKAGQYTADILEAFLREAERRKAMEQENPEPAEPPPPPASIVIAPASPDLSPETEEWLARVQRYLQNSNKTMPSQSIIPSDAKWRDVLILPFLILILGKKGSGKSALAYHIAELLRFSRKVFIVGFPEASKHLLPDWIGIVQSIQDLPPHSIAIVDEAYLPFHSRSSTSAQAIAMSQLLNLSRQRDQTIIFVTQEARQVDRNIASAANVIAFKDLGMLQVRFDRRELAQLAEEAGQALGAISKKDRQQWSYVYAPDVDFKGLLANEKPSFWSPSMSKAFGTSGVPAKSKNAKKVSREEKISEAKRLHREGLSYQEIARILGVGKSTVPNYLRGYPYSKP